jgi:predicted DNA repair protein MutK
MPGGLVALLDDVAAMAKLAAASVDDVAGAAGRAGAKAAGVVIDDTAVTPTYVTRLSPERELPIIWKITKGSLRNKLVFLLPAAIALSAFAPWAIVPLLMLGGAYLCFEATEKIWEAISHTGHAEEVIEITDPDELEQRQVGGAVRTDFILSAEIMAIALGELGSEGLVRQAIVLAVVAVAITIGVYGTVALIVKMDDIGLHLAERRRSTAAARAFGRGLVHAMPILLSALSLIGTAAMLWVGGGIFSHGLEELDLAAVVPHTIHDLAVAAGEAVPAAQAVVEWVVGALGSAVVGIVVGGVIVAAFHLWPRKKAKAPPSA